MDLNVAKTTSLMHKCFKTYAKKGFVEKLELRFIEFALISRKKNKACFLELFLSSVKVASSVVQFKSVKLRGNSIRVPFYIQKVNKQLKTAGLKIFHSNLKEFCKELLDLKISEAKI